ncbi:nitrate ABC transporter substrate-binding protein [soil metagenome]
MTVYKKWVAVAAIGSSAALAGCSSSTTEPAAEPSTDERAASAYSTDLSGVCPETIVIQTGWFPQPERGYLYQLIGTQGVVDIDKGAYVGPLGSTGVNLEVRVGGPYVGDQSAVSMLYQDSDILLGEVNTDEGLNLHTEFPTVAVFAPLEQSPQVLLWDPAQHNFGSMADIGASELPVLVYGSEDPWVTYFVGEGQLNAAQIDDSYDGSPSRLVASDGQVVQQGYVTSEPFTYENDFPEWGKPVESMLLAEAGYSPYENALGATPENVERHADCLTGLVPLLQQAQVDYMTDPAPMNERLVSIVDELASSWSLTLAANEFATTTMTERGIAGNGPNATLGDFDAARVAEFNTLITPILQESNPDFTPLPDPSVIYTNQFINPDIGL